MAKWTPEQEALVREYIPRIRSGKISAHKSAVELTSKIDKSKNSIYDKIGRFLDEPESKPEPIRPIPGYIHQQWEF